MMIDPLSALGVASNIIQFIDFAVKLLTGTERIYKSACGSSENTRVLHAITEDLRQLGNTIKVSEGGDPKLEQLAGECTTACHELLQVLQTLRLQGKRTHWKSFKVAMKEAWNRGRVETMYKRLAEIRAQLNTHVQHLIKNEMFDISTAIQKLNLTDANLHQHNVRVQESDHRPMISSFPSVTTSYELLKTQLSQEQDASRDRDHLAPWLSDILGDFHRMHQSISEVERCQRFLQCLSFENIQLRRDRIPEAHYKTFNWIFDLSDTSRSHHFARWLRSQGGTFWIQGKAGSGKSTLMKFLSSHPDTISHLRTWACGKSLVVAHFYFWNSGINLQKSEEGLLRSLLFEMLREHPDLVPSMITARAQFRQETMGLRTASSLEATSSEPVNVIRPGIFSSEYSKSWNLQELLAVYDALMRQQRSMRFCIFIDGLDEYHDENCRDHRDLIHTLRKLAGTPNIKLCLSSRPWTIFYDAFGTEAELTFRLEDLTSQDIFRYVSDKFERHDQYHRLKDRDPRYMDLIQEVVTKAQGVFLWVFLVVQELLEGLTYNDTIDTMRLRLSQFPEELDPFFEHMLGSIPRVYRKESAETFSIALAGPGPLLLLIYSWVDDLRGSFPNAAGWELRRPFMLSEIAATQEVMRRRLDGRCRGLLEVSRSTRSDAFREYKVDFLHRTVRDYFLQCQGARDFIREYNPPNGSLWRMACEAIYFGLKFGPRDLSWIQESWENFHRFAYRIFAESGHLEILDSISNAMEATTTDLVDRLGATEGFPDLDIIEILTACRYGLTDYVKRMVANRLGYIPRYCSDLARSSLASRILRSSLIPNPISGAFCIELVNFALDLGANPNDTLHGTSPFEAFIHALNSCASPPSLDGSLEVLKSLVRQGAKLHTPMAAREPGQPVLTPAAILARHYTKVQYSLILAEEPSDHESEVNNPPTKNKEAGHTLQQAPRMTKTSLSARPKLKPKKIGIRKPIMRNANASKLEGLLKNRAQKPSHVWRKKDVA